MKIKIGCDPEVFLKNAKSGEYISAAGLFPGDKKNPFPVEKGAVQVDGTALEFNIHPAENEDDFFNNIYTVYKQMQEMVSKVDKELVLAPKPIVNFNANIWEAIPIDAKILGCDPDYNIKGEVNPNPSDKIFNLPLRTGSGHIHIGWSDGENVNDPSHFEDCRFMAHQFFLRGVHRPVTDDENKRLRYYGGNGAFRPKPYGVELRSPSPLWIKSEQGIREMFRKTSKNFFEIAGA